MRKAAKSVMPAVILSANMPSRVRIYTRTGDRGETSLYGGRRIPKSHLQIEAYGTVDELNSFIGLALAEITHNEVRLFLTAVQRDLFSIGSYLSGYEKEELDLSLRVGELEKIIDEVDKKLPELKNFVLPGGGKLASNLHVARAVSRRAERVTVRFFNEEETSIPNPRKEKIMIYLNRVSDLLFVLARFANKLDNVSEELWKIK